MRANLLDLYRLSCCALVIYSTHCDVTEQEPWEKNEHFFFVLFLRRKNIYGVYLSFTVEEVPSLAHVKHTITLLMKYYISIQIL